MRTVAAPRLLEVMVVASILLAAGLGADLGLSGLRGFGFAALLAAAAWVLALSTRKLARRQIIAGAVAVGFLALSLAVGLEHSGGAAQTLKTGIAYVPLLLVLGVTTRDGGRRVGMVVAAYASVLAVLYVIQASTGWGLVPGAYRMTTAESHGVALRRVYAPGGILFIFGVGWLLAHLPSISHRRRVFAGIGAGLCAAAALATLSRTVVVGLAASVFVIVLLSSPFGAYRRRLALLAALVFVVFGAIFHQGLSNAVHEVATTSGNWGYRIHVLRTHESTFEKHPVFGVGFAPETTRAGAAVDTSDSSLITIGLRFGAVGLALALLALVRVGVSAYRLKGSDSPTPIAPYAASYITFAIIAAFSTDVLIAPAGTAILGFTLGAALSAEALRRSDAGVEEAAVQARAQPDAVIADVR